MDALGKHLFTGTWKSFKFFKHSGDVKFYTHQHFKEFDFNSNGWLTIKLFKADHVEKLAQTDQWMVTFNDRRHYLKIPLYHLSYEVITVNHTVLVLLDTSTSDKIFLAREPHWSSFLQSNKELVL